MELLRELMRLQEEHGYLKDELLSELSSRRGVPLYRLEGLVSFYPVFRRSPPPKVRVQTCRDISCAMAGSEALAAALRDSYGNRVDVEICEASCLGRCDGAPAVAINDVPFSGSDVPEVNRLIENPERLEKLVPTDAPRRWKCDPYDDPDARYGTAKQLVASSGAIGQQCIERLKASQLCGMGGAGFPTGRKWELVAGEVAYPKYVICNADESEPGTFKDRVILEELPHLVLEGMLLAALTIGAEEGIVYLRHEYGKEHRALAAAIDDARKRGILGENAAGSGARFDIEIFESPGGYILGEETALLEALEDQRGEPRTKPPYPGTCGLWGKPTLINNVETFALATAIIHHGPSWWEAQAEGKFTGLKFACVSGDVEQPGVYEIPIGTTVTDLIKLAGGVKDGKQLAAFLPGGASSNFLPAEKSDTPLDFKSMEAAGSMLGTAALIVVAEGHNLFGLATNLVRFFRNESCGKCVPCRIGTEQTVSMLERMVAGIIDKGQLDGLPQLADTLEQTSLCGLGQVALNPILSLLKHFPTAAQLDRT